jgi:hypothetical protein
MLFRGQDTVNASESVEMIERFVETGNKEWREGKNDRSKSM